MTFDSFSSFSSSSSNSSMEKKIYPLLEKLDFFSLSDSWQQLILDRFNQETARLIRSTKKVETFQAMVQTVENFSRITKWKRIYSNKRILFLLCLFDEFPVNTMKTLAENIALFLNQELDHTTISSIKNDIKYSLSILERFQLLETTVMKFSNPSMRNVKIYFTPWSTSEEKKELRAFYEKISEGVGFNKKKPLTKEDIIATQKEKSKAAVLGRMEGENIIKHKKLTNYMKEKNITFCQKCKKQIQFSGYKVPDYCQKCQDQR